MGFSDNNYGKVKGEAYAKTTHYLFKQFDEELTPTVKSRIGAISENIMNENYDMMGILGAKEVLKSAPNREDAKKVLVVLSDGAPLGDSREWDRVIRKARARYDPTGRKSVKYEMDTSGSRWIDPEREMKRWKEATRFAVDTTRKDSNVVFCLRMDQDTSPDHVKEVETEVASIYGKKHTVVTPTSKLAKKLGRILKGALLK